MLEKTKKWLDYEERAEIEVVDGYPMIAPFEFYSLDDIAEMKEVNVEDEKKRYNSDIAEEALYLRNLNDPTKAKAIMGAFLDENGRGHLESEIEGLEECFFVLKGRGKGKPSKSAEERKYAHEKFEKNKKELEKKAKKEGWSEEKLREALIEAFTNRYE